jgi:formylglycine-generating enzyme required for sulfatase activity
MHLFISHATKDSGREALALAEALEAQGHVCWIAPRDVRPGIPYPRQIVEALEQCYGLVLLLSPAANDSADVLQEVQLAAQAKKTIAPVVLAGTPPGADLRYYVSVRHQIAWSGGEETALRLAQTFPAHTTTEEASLPAEWGRGQGEGAPPPSMRDASPEGGKKLPRWFFEAVGVWIFIALIAVLVWQPWRNSGAPAPSPATTEAADAHDAGGGAGAPYPDVQSFRDCDFCPEMVVVPSGEFTMGAVAGDTLAEPDEKPTRSVRVASFASGRYEVTFAEWDACVERGGCRVDYPMDDEGWGRDRRPLMGLTWEEAQSYVRWLSAQTGRSYRLLTEAEWEYAARAGTSTTWYWGSRPVPPCGSARFRDVGCSPEARSTVPVGSFEANAFGLYDMFGNVEEWVADCYTSSYTEAQSSACPYRVLRGGSFAHRMADLRSSSRRGGIANDLADRVWMRLRGFRVATSDLAAR